MAPGTQQQRFADYLHRLAQAAGHLDRATPLQLYCTGLLLPGERKSVEPMAAGGSNATVLWPGRQARELPGGGEFVAEYGPSKSADCLASLLAGSVDSVNLIWPTLIVLFGPPLVNMKIEFGKEPRRRACGNCEKAERRERGAFQAAVGIRGVGGFPSAASVSTGLPSFFFAPFFFLGAHSRFFAENFAPGCFRGDDSHSRRPMTSPVFVHYGRLLPSPFRFLFSFFFSNVLRKRYDSVPVSMIWA